MRVPILFIIARAAFDVVITVLDWNYPPGPHRKCIQDGNMLCEDTRFILHATDFQREMQTHAEKEKYGYNEEEVGGNRNTKQVRSTFQNSREDGKN